MKILGIYLVENPEENINPCGCYDFCLVCANSEEEARQIYPEVRCSTNYSNSKWDETKKRWVYQHLDGRSFEEHCSNWASPKEVKVTYLGIASEDVEEGLIKGSYYTEY